MAVACWTRWRYVGPGMSLALDHVFCAIDDPDRAVRRIQSAGWVLDAGSVHAGQGTRNRRLVWREQYLESVWVADALEARTNPLRLDRRGDWLTTGASPFGFGLRGQLPDCSRGDYWAVRGARATDLGASRQRASAGASAGVRAGADRRGSSTATKGNEGPGPPELADQAPAGGSPRSGSGTGASPAPHRGAHRSF